MTERELKLIALAEGILNASAGDDFVYLRDHAICTRCEKLINLPDIFNHERETHRREHQH